MYSLLIIYLHFQSDLMNAWQFLNNWFVNNIILNLEMMNWLFKNYEKKYIKNIIDMNQKLIIYISIYKQFSTVY